METKSTDTIYIVTKALADVTARAIQAEREVIKAQRESAEWYSNWQRKNAELEDVKGRLAAEIENHQNTMQALKKAQEAAEKKKEREKSSGKS